MTRGPRDGPRWLLLAGLAVVAAAVLIALLVLSGRQVALSAYAKPAYVWPAAIIAFLIVAWALTAALARRRRSALRLASLILALAALGCYLLAVNPVLVLIKQGLDLKGGVHVVLEAQDLPGSPVTEESMRTVQAILEARVDALGVAEPRVEREGANRIVVELPGIADPDRALEDIGRTAFLEFAEWFDLYLADGGEDPAAVRAVLQSELGMSASAAASLVQKAATGPQLIRSQLEYAPLLDLAEPLFDAGAGLVEDAMVILTGKDLRSGGARAVLDPDNRPVVSLSFTEEGTRKFADLTARRVGKPVYILLDRQLVQAPIVSEPITTGQAQITGYASYDDAFRIAVVLNSGALPVKLVPLAPQVVSATLGADSIARSKTAGVISIVAVVVFMLVFYRAAGLLADIALSLYILLVLVALVGINATLTLPGIAGLLLSVGMAVDANVITFERIREELRLGKTIRSAIESGYARALRTIIDANVTTLIAAIVLFYLGSRGVRGFAVTLAVGIVVSMLTAVYATRLLLRLAADAGLLSDPRLFLGRAPKAGGGRLA
jgi:preprotein translocase subunit SecD